MTRARDLADSADKDIAGTVTLDDIILANDITLADNGKAIFGAGSDLSIFHNGSSSLIEDSGTGGLTIRSNLLTVQNAAGNETVAQFVQDGFVKLFHNNSQVFTTTSTGIDVTGTAVTDGLTVAGNVSVDGGTIKLDGNYPVGTQNVALGDAALDDGSLSGGFNTAIGRASLSNNTSGANNSALGNGSLQNNTTASNNTAVGYQSLYANTSSSNTAVGNLAAKNATTATGLVIVGREAGRDLTTGSQNTALGYDAMQKTTTGGSNVSLGFRALFSNTTASSNTAVGYQAGYSNTGNGGLTHLGYRAGYSGTGAYNTLIGYQAGKDITTGQRNTVLGAYNGNQGGLDIRTTSNNIVLSDGDGNPRMYWHGGLSSPLWEIKNSGGNGQWIARFSNTTNSGSPYGVNIRFTQVAPDNNSTQFITCSDTGGVRMLVTNQGDLQNHDNSYGAISDVKLKEQIEDASSQWQDIKDLTIRKYKMKTDIADKGDSNELWRLGVVAQEVETAGMSGLVYETPDMDEDNNDLGTTTKAVKYSILYMKAVKALQEAMDRIETLEAKVTALETP